jgi:hypothetical protein
MTFLILEYLTHKQRSFHEHERSDWRNVENALRGQIEEIEKTISLRISVSSTGSSGLSRTRIHFDNQTVHKHTSDDSYTHNSTFGQRVRLPG